MDFGVGRLFYFVVLYILWYFIKFLYFFYWFWSMLEVKENFFVDKVDGNIKLSDNNGFSEDVDVKMLEEE